MVPGRLVEVLDQGGARPGVWVLARRTDNRLDMLTSSRGEERKEGVESLSLSGVEGLDMTVKETEPRHRLPLPKVRELTVSYLELGRSRSRGR